ncbi:MAG: molybdopterin-dependent oxidoreductase [Nitrospirae bacterium]|nr:molybdopterin-dependent oxidoreductase [Nitrospirota bacterium]
MSAAPLAALIAPRRVRAGWFDALFSTPARTTPAITPNKDFYVTSCCSTPRPPKPEHWSLTVKGLVNHPITLRYDDVLARPAVREIVTLECIGNPIGGESISTAEWGGIRLAELLSEAGVTPGAVDLVMRAADGYSDSFPIRRALESDVLLAYTMNGDPLPREHGYPVRIIVPGIYGMKHVKWLTELEVVDQDYRGYWERKGWSDEALVKLRSRIDAPGDGEQVPVGVVTLRGIAFGGRSRVGRVEVSSDGGRAWQVASLAPPLSPHAWTHWSYAWRIPRAGSYSLTARAIDDAGAVQSADAGDPFPGGASGLHTVRVTAV